MSSFSGIAIFGFGAGVSIFTTFSVFDAACSAGAGAEWSVFCFLAASDTNKKK